MLKFGFRKKSLITRATVGSSGLVVFSSLPVHLKVNNTIIQGFEDIYMVEAAGSTFSGNNNVYHTWTRISHPFIENNSYSLEDWKTYSEQDSDSSTTDPLFVSNLLDTDISGTYDFSTQVGSPAKTLFAGIADKPPSYTAPSWVDARVASIVNY